MFFYDLKVMDNDAHIRFVGMGNGRIRENFITLSKETKHLQARMPVIPGVNDNRENIAATARFKFPDTIGVIFLYTVPVKRLIVSRRYHFEYGKFPLLCLDPFLEIFIRIFPVALQHGNDSHFQYSIQPVTPFACPFS